MHHRVKELLIQHVATFDGTSFQFPPPLNFDQTENVDFNENRISKEMKSSTKQLCDKLNTLYVNYESFKQKRNELNNIVKDLNIADDDDKENNIKTRSQKTSKKEKEIQEEKLAGLVRKRIELQSKLKKLKAYQSEQNEKDKELVSQWNKVSTGSLDYMENDSNELAKKLRDVVKNKDNLKLYVQKLEEKEAWYKTMKQIHEQISGVKLLSMENYNDKEDTDNSPDMCTKFLLIEKYPLKVDFTSTSKSAINSSQNISINSVTLGNDHLIIRSKDNTVTLPLPEISDLVQVARNLPSSESLRVLIRDTISRIIATQLRADELSQARKKFVTKILKSSDEVICSLNEGVTVRIRLTADCPLRNGTAYIEEIAGIGGWPIETLEKIRSDVNGIISKGEIVGGKESSNSPIMIIMDLLKEHVKKVNVPGTPRLNFGFKERK